MVSRCRTCRSGRLASTAARHSALVIMMGRRRTRSIHTPTNRPRARNGREERALRTPISPGVAVSVITAVSGRASRVIWLPSWEMLSPVQNLTNSRLRQIEPAPAELLIRHGPLFRIWLAPKVAGGAHRGGRGVGDNG